MPTLHVVIPFYDEGATLDACVRRVEAVRMQAGWRLAFVLVDDHSARAETGRDALCGLTERGQTARLIRHDVNCGKGAAVMSGFDAILSGGADDDDVLIIQDADLEYDPADFTRLMQPLLEGRADAVIGNRWAGRRPAGLKRRLHMAANRLLTQASNWVTGYRISDMECCYKLMPVRLLRRLRPRLDQPRYGIEPQLVAALAATRARVCEVPVAYDPRSFAAGKKIRWTDGLAALWVIARERARGAERG